MWDSIVSGISNIGKAIGGLFGVGGASNGVSSATANALENQMAQNGGKLFTSYISNPVGVDNAVLNTVTNMPSATIGLTGGMAGAGAGAGVTNIPNGNSFGSNITNGILGSETGSHSFGLKDIANIAATGYDLYNKYKTDKINRENAQYDLDWKKSENNRLKKQRQNITSSYQDGKVF